MPCENSIQSSIVRCLRSIKFLLSSRSKAMQITKFLAVAVVLTASTCRAKIVVPTSNPVESRLVDDLVQMVTSCYKDRINAVGLVGDLPDRLIKTLAVQHSIPTILMYDTRVSIVPEVLAPVPLRYKLHVFIIGFSSPRKLFGTQRMLLKSIWWNPMASVIILDQSPNCSNFLYYLFLFWKIGSLNAKVMCYTTEWHRRVIFNFNPFTRQAPHSWALFPIFQRGTVHPFTVFRRSYRRTDLNCVDLDFVKTNNLGGYEIIIQGMGEFEMRQIVLRYVGLMNTANSWVRQKRILDIMVRAVNATARFTVADIGADEYEFKEEIAAATVPIWSTPIISSPNRYSGVVLVSNYQGHKSQLEKIMSVTDVDSRIGMGIVYLISLFFFKFIVHQALVPSILNLVRMTCNTGFSNLRDNTAQRMYLTGLLFFVVTMQGIYQGNLASLLTNKIPRRNVNSIQDVVNGGYTLYTPRTFKFLAKDSGVKEYFIENGVTGECVMKVVNDLSAVCLIAAEDSTIDLARRYDLHFSNKFITEVPFGFPIQPFWYLEERVNIIFRTMMEADIFDTWDSKCNPFQLDDFQFDKEVLTNTDYKIIELSEVLFAFVILSIGLVCATVIFVIEVATY